MNKQPGEEGYVPPSVEELQKQIENLNKGIAGYRDEAKNAKTEAELARQEAAIAKAAAESAKTNKGDEDDVPQLNSDDQKKLEAWAKSQGFVTKEELEAQSNKIFSDTIKNIEDQALTEFLQKYPQFEKDEEFAKVKEQFALYKQPTNLQGYRTVLSKVVKDLGIGADDGTARAKAEMATRARLALGGGSTKSDDEAESQIDEYMKRYPRLSREQIIDRLSEINTLAAEKDKAKKK